MAGHPKEKKKLKFRNFLRSRGDGTFKHIHPSTCRALKQHTPHTGGRGRVFLQQQFLNVWTLGSSPSVSCRPAQCTKERTNMGISLHIITSKVTCGAQSGNYCSAGREARSLCSGGGDGQGFRPPCSHVEQTALSKEPNAFRGNLPHCSTVKLKQQGDSFLTYSHLFP